MSQKGPLDVMPLQNKRPSPELMRELEEVAEKAVRFKDFLRHANFLPADFPKNEVEQQLIALAGLPQGTAEGCKEPLLLARHRLMNLRRSYLTFDDQPANSDDPDAPPATTRGTSLDVRISELYASVGTALDQYQLEAAAEIEDETYAEPVVEGVTGNVLGRAVGRSHDLEQTLDSAKKQLDEVSIKESENTDTLRRLLTDAQNENRILRAELQMPSTRVGWLTPLRNRLKRTPEYIVRATKTLRVGADITKVLHFRFREAKGDAITFLYDQFDKTLDAVDKVSAILEEVRDERIKTNASAPDYNYQTALNMILRRKLPPAHWIPSIVSLNFFETGLLDVTPLAGLNALEWLSLESTRVGDVSALANLTGLKTLHLTNTRVSDVSPLANLTGLEFLILNSTQVSDVSPLASLSRLRLLNVDNTLVTDVSALDHLVANGLEIVVRPREPE